MSMSTLCVHMDPQLDMDLVLCAGKTSPGRRRGLLVEEDFVGLAALYGFGLHCGDLLGGEFARVFALDVGDPLGALLGLGLVELNLAAVEGLVDLFEEGVDELGLRDLAQRFAAGEDQALVLGAGDAEVGVAGLADAVDGA